MSAYWESELSVQELEQQLQKNLYYRSKKHPNNWVWFGHYKTNVITIDKSDVVELVGKKGTANVYKLRDGGLFIYGGEIHSSENANKNRLRVFSWTPICWDIAKEDDDYLWLISSRIISASAYNSKGACPYKDSTVRKLLNKTLYDTAFTTQEKELIQLQRNSNGATQNTDPYMANEPSEDTDDYLWLPSADDLTIGDYSFSTKNTSPLESREKDVTPYAKNIGARVESANGTWLTRTISTYHRGLVVLVSEEGNLCCYGDPASREWGIAPMLKIKK